MADYDTPTPNTLLFRALPVQHAAAALRMLDESGPEPDTPVDPRWVFTLADVASGPDLMPIAACVVAHGPGSPYAWIGRFAVALPFRRRGLGRRLLAETETALRAEGVHRLFVRVRAADEGMRRLLGSGGPVTSRAGSPEGWPEGPSPGDDARLWSWSGRDL